MRHFGVLGHTSEGAALCFRAFCQEGFATLGPHEHPDVTLDCIALVRTIAALEAGDLDSVRATLAVSVERLARAGADFFACPSNTAHEALEHPGPDLALPGLHIADVVAESASRNGHRRVGVLGTKYTMDGPLYPRALAAHGLSAVVPDASDRGTVNAIVFNELVQGVFTDASRRVCVGIIEDLVARGCDAVALVCTELPLLVTPDDAPVPTLDSTRLLARAAFEVAVEHRPMPTWRGGVVPAARAVS